MNKIIICPKCGIIPFYTNFEIQKVYFAFDAYGNEVDLSYDPEGIKSSTVKRCFDCGSKVKITEGGEEE